MKSKQRILTAALLLLALLCTACAPTPAANGETSLVQRGLLLAQTMDELASTEGYRKAMSASEELNAEIARMSAGEYGAPKAAYLISLPDKEALLSFFEMEPATLSDTLNTWLVGRSYSSVPNLLIARSGAAVLAASACVTYGESFVAPGVTAPELYLYQYDGDYCVMALFVPGRDNAVNGTVYFVPNSEQLMACTSAESLAGWLGESLPWQVTVSPASMK